ncbi:hypothetical protein WICPIJ_004162 [Wickerhamomyces pijperi]|uniref:Uncharacterized protein n=1 Tax=Wickerhamomyces pijperi TaxID=599730 RepID=A0A9P8TN61_WICPI|nr:hypothetical protein WICPIJ_004162 [Wickerhamomyces pijperi]
MLIECSQEQGEDGVYHEQDNSTHRGDDLWLAENVGEEQKHERVEEVDQVDQDVEHVGSGVHVRSVPAQPNKVEQLDGKDTDSLSLTTVLH